MQLQLARGEHRLQDVRGVERAAARGAGADDGVDLVDEEDRARDLAERRDHRLQALLEVAAKARAREQRAHVERVDARALEQIGNVALVDLQRQALGERGLADPGLADEDRVVLAAPAQHARGPRELLGAPDQRIDLARRPRAPPGRRRRARAGPSARVPGSLAVLVLVVVAANHVSATPPSSAIFETPCEM